MRWGLVLVAGLAVVVLPPLEAAAQDWKVSGRFSQRFSADSNRELDPDGNDTSFGSTTGLSLRTQLDTPRSQFSLFTGVNLRAFTGSDRDDEIDVASPALNATFRHRGIGWTGGTNLRFRRTNTSFRSVVSAADFDTGGSDPGDVDDGDDPSNGVGSDIASDRDATRTDISVGGNLSFNLTQRNTLSLNAGSRIVRFSDDDSSLEPSTSFSGGASFSRRVSPLTTLSATLNGRFIRIDDEENTRSAGITARVGVSRQLSPRMSLSFSGGATVSQIDRDATDRSSARDEITVSPSTAASLRYQEGERSFTLSLSQAVTPNSEGEITDRTNIGASFTQPINQTQRFRLRAGASRSSSTGGSSGTDFGFEISPSYSIDLTREWRASLGYRFRLGNDNDDGTAISNGVFLGVSRPLRIY